MQNGLDSIYLNVQAPAILAGPHRRGYLELLAILLATVVFSTFISSLAIADAIDGNESSRDSMTTHFRNRPPAKAQAFFIINLDGQPIAQLAGERFAQSAGGEYEDHSTVNLAAAKDLAQRDALIAQITEAAKKPLPIDIFIFSHGNDFHLWFAKLAPQVRAKIRLVYDAGCDDAGHGSDWKDLGVGAYIGHKGTSASPIFLHRFWTYWREGYTLAKSVDYANDQVEKDTQLPGLEKYAKGTPAQIFGESRLTRDSKHPTILAQPKAWNRLPDRDWTISVSTGVKCLTKDRNSPLSESEYAAIHSNLEINTVSCAQIDPTSAKSPHDFAQKTFLNTRVILPYTAQTGSAPLDFTGSTLLSETNLVTVQNEELDLRSSKWTDARIDTGRAFEITRGNLDKSEWQNTTLRKITIQKSRAQDAVWNGARIQGLSIESSDFSRTTWNGASIKASQFLGTSLVNSSWQNAVFEQVEFLSANLDHSDFRGISGTVTFGGSLKSADFRGADLRKTQILVGCDKLTGLRWDDQTRASPEILNIFKTCGINKESLQPVAKATPPQIKGFTEYPSDAPTLMTEAAAQTGHALNGVPEGSDDADSAE